MYIYKKTLKFVNKDVSTSDFRSSATFFLSWELVRQLAQGLKLIPNAIHFHEVRSIGQPQLHPQIALASEMFGQSDERLLRR